MIQGPIFSFAYRTVEAIFGTRADTFPLNLAIKIHIYFWLFFFTSQSTRSRALIVQIKRNKNKTNYNYQKHKQYIMEKNLNGTGDYVFLQKHISITPKCKLCLSQANQSLLKICKCFPNSFIHQSCLNKYAEQETQYNSKIKVINNKKGCISKISCKHCKFSMVFLNYLFVQKLKISDKNRRNVYLFLLFMILWNICSVIFIMLIRSNLSVESIIFTSLLFIALPDLYFTDKIIQVCLTKQKINQTSINEKIAKQKPFCRFCFCVDGTLQKYCKCSEISSYCHEKCLQNQIQNEYEKESTCIKQYEKEGKREYEFECQCLQKIYFNVIKGFKWKRSNNKFYIFYILWLMSFLISLTVSIVRGNEVFEILLFYILVYIFPAALVGFAFMSFIWVDKIKMKQKQEINLTTI